MDFFSMMCPNCNEPVEPGADFCSNCGYAFVSEISKEIHESEAEIEYTELEPADSYVEDEYIDYEEDYKPSKKNKKYIKDEKRREKLRAKTTKQKFIYYAIRLLISLLIILFVTFALSFALYYFRIVDIPLMDNLPRKSITHTKDKKETEDIDIHDGPQYSVEPIDADEYFNENANRVVNVKDAKTSDSVMSERETTQLLNRIGFDEYPAESPYTMDGDYEEEQIDAGGSEKHPLYQTYYHNTNGDLWTIFVIDGQVMAKPVTFCMEAELDAEVLVSEKDTLVSYDATTNQFYETVPGRNRVILIVVDEINSNTLDELTISRLNDYVR